MYGAGYSFDFSVRPAVSVVDGVCVDVTFIVCSGVLPKWQDFYVAMLFVRLLSDSQEMYS